MTPPSTSTAARIRHPRVLLLVRLACGLFMAAYAVLFGTALAKTLQIHDANAFGFATRWTFEGELRLNPYASSPAAQAGIRVGDILVTFNGQPVENGFTLVSEPGVPAVLGVRGEDGTVRDYTLTPHEHPLAFADVLLRLGIPRDISTAIALAIAFATLLCFWGVGLLMFWRRSDNPMSL